MNAPHPITLSARVDRILKLCSTPAAASRACERIYGLARKRVAAAIASKSNRLLNEGRALHALSNAMNEHRHAILCSFIGDDAGVREHVTNRTRELQRALEIA